MLERLLEDEQERRASLERQLCALQGGAPPSAQPQPVRPLLCCPSSSAAAAALALCLQDLDLAALRASRKHAWCCFLGSAEGLMSDGCRSALFTSSSLHHGKS